MVDVKESDFKDTARAIVSGDPKAAAVAVAGALGLVAGGPVAGGLASGVVALTTDQVNYCGRKDWNDEVKGEWGASERWRGEEGTDEQATPRSERGRT